MKHINPNMVATLGTDIALILAKGKSIAEINLIKNVVNQVSATLNTIVCQKIMIDSDKSKK